MRGTSGLRVFVILGVAGGVVGCLSSAALGQSFNIDLEHANTGTPGWSVGAPTAAFPGASGQVGFWNAVPTNSTGPVALNDLSNVATSVSLTMTTNAPNGFAHWQFNNTSNTGDMARLLNDCHVVNNTPGPWVNTYTFTGLQPGIYLVYVYGVRPMTGVSATRTTLIGGTGPQMITGPMPGNAFALGVTHSLDAVMVTGGTLVVTVDCPPTPTGAGAYANGFQLVYMVPSPGAAGVLGAAMLVGLRRRRRA
jgi:hypothetical protein